MVIEESLYQMQTIQTPYAEGPLSDLYDSAHEIRGIAGSFDRVEMAALCDSLCRYLDATHDKFAIDDRLVEAHINAISMFSRVEEAEMAAADTILIALRTAVQKKSNCETIDLATKQ
jgi:hypothetical protein